MADIRAIKTDTARKAVNIALQGGGAHGAFGWGVLDQLAEDGRIGIEGLSATSAGAMNAVVYAYGNMKGGAAGAREALELFWRRISEAGKVNSPMKSTPLDLWLKAFGYRDNLSFQMFEAVTHLLSPYQFNPFGLNPLRDVLQETVNFQELRGCSETILRICATNVRTGQPKIFTNEMMSLDAVLASACLPMLFQAVEIEAEHYWDGGYIGNPAIYPIIYDAPSPDILIIHINPIVRNEVPKHASEIFNRINEVSFNSSLIRELRAIAFATKLIDEDWIRPEHKHKLKRLFIHAIRSDETMREFSVASKFNTDWQFLTELRDMGRQMTKVWLDRHFDDIGHRSSVDLQKEYF
jgi:NTE family protein